LQVRYRSGALAALMAMRARKRGSRTHGGIRVMKFIDEADIRVEAAARVIGVWDRGRIDQVVRNPNPALKTRASQG